MFTGTSSLAMAEALPDDGQVRPCLCTPHFQPCNILSSLHLQAPSCQLLDFGCCGADGLHVLIEPSCSLLCASDPVAASHWGPIAMHKNQVPRARTNQLNLLC